MLDITGDNIRELSDSDLRSLIGLLCEAELRCNGLPTAGVTWGGHQNAPDGGIDVRVEVSQAPHSDCFIPRARTGFQVKKPDMPPSEIKKEMKPEGELRESIIDLVNSSGAYIIVSSQGSTADSALDDRKKAMQEALDELPNASNIKVDFYDRGRVATWVRTHPAIVLWVREKIGHPIQGWEPYGNWANCPEGIESEYLSDDTTRVKSTSSLDGWNAIEGILVIRNLLHQPASSVRLTGLSGVGKTRLLQALFDARVGENPLNKSQVYYTDISYSPNPDARSFAEQLIALRKPAILVVDNCSPELHRHLTSDCTTSGSSVSLITVEYDIQEDQPEETEVFRLEPASDDLIEKIIRRGFPEVSQVDSRTIAKFSGGNARIAIALARTVKPGESLSYLKDPDLFERLFYQNNEKPDKDLLKAAEVCSLVYSFECKIDDEEENLELQLLGSLVEMTVKQLYGHSSELKRRELIQQRGVWRAILPNAIANRLATRALEDIPLSEIRKAFEQKGSERILQSFSTRLSYLHESDEARKVAKRWLSDDGLLADISNLNPLKMNLFKNITPIEPEAAITAIEKAAKSDSSGKFLSIENPNHVEFGRLLRSLAYDEKLFSRSVNLLCQFALSANLQGNRIPLDPLDPLTSLFHIYLSGTHAPAEQRLRIISELMNASDEQHINLAFKLLDATLKARDFSSMHSFEFGAHSRDYGFRPKNREEEKHWFKLFIDFTVNCATSESLSARQAKSLLAEKFGELWTWAGMFDELEDAANRIIEKGTWNEGWKAAKETLRFDKGRLGPELTSRLNVLATRLAPRTLIDRVRLYVLSGHRYIFDEVDAIRSLGQEAGKTI